MSEMLRHEIAYRSKEAIAAVAKQKVWIFGAGALGSHIAMNLARSGSEHIGISDFDRVEGHNINTQVYSRDHVGLLKVKALEDLLSTVSDNEVPTWSRKHEDLKSIDKLLDDDYLMVDCFDNAAGRSLLYDASTNINLPCVHVGVNGDFGEIKWNKRYIVPSGLGEDICEYPLANAFVNFMAAIATETIIRYVTTGRKQNAEVTFGDYRVRVYE